MTDPARRLTPVVRLAPAKLNLTLAVVGRRPDGYHVLHSVMVPLGLADRLSLAQAAGRSDTLHVSGRDAGPVADNLVLRALSAARAAVGGGWPGRIGAPPTFAGPPALSARLDKLIPVAAGLAGGSSDAAAAIDGALEAWGVELGLEERTAIAIRVGSDVPFFLVGGPALVEGRGEHVTPLAPVRGDPPGILLVTPSLAVSTRDVFDAYAAGIRPGSGGSTRATSEHLAAEMKAGLTNADLLSRASVLASANDLLPAALALVPALVGFRRGLVRVLGRPVGQSGSGPTCWVIYPSHAEASRAAEAVRAAISDGRLPSIGGPEPSVEATTIVGSTPDGS